jgi:hypothetical protein
LHLGFPSNHTRKGCNYTLFKEKTAEDSLD